MQTGLVGCSNAAPFPGSLFGCFSSQTMWQQQGSRAASTDRLQAAAAKRGSQTTASYVALARQPAPAALLNTKRHRALGPPPLDTAVSRSEAATKLSPTAAGFTGSQESTPQDHNRSRAAGCQPTYHVIPSAQVSEAAVRLCVAGAHTPFGLLDINLCSPASAIWA